MRKSLWIMLAILLVAIAAPAAHADSVVYAINFIGFPTFVGPGPNQFDYSTTQMQFTSPSGFDLYFGRYRTTVLMLLSPNEFVAPTDSFIWSQVDEFVQIRDTDTENSPYSGNLPFNPHQNFEGDVTFTAQTPEPSTALPWLVWFGLVLVMRKRFSGLHHAS